MMKISLLLLLVTLPSCFAYYNATTGWQTLTQGPPLVIANGGSSGILPGQTDPAYIDAANSTKFPVAFLCDLQLTKDNMGVCRTGWNLSVSTNLSNILTNLSAPSTYVIQGVPQTGYFSVDFNLTQLNQTTAIQPSIARSPDYDGQFPILTPEHVATAIGPTVGLYFWLNIEYPSFYQQHPGKNSLASYLTTFLKTYQPFYMSATEVGILKLLAPTAVRTRTYLCLKVGGMDDIEESTNATYGTILSNLTDIATYAQGILVPRELVYPRINAYNDSTLGYYTGPASNFVQQAHSANLEVYVYGFANDNFPSSYNYSFDPVLEVVNYVGNTFQVDGVLTDFPTTASEAINCYLDGYVDAPVSKRDTSKSVANPLIISHNGASGDFPGCTLSSYAAAINDGADYIDCTVQISSDGVPFCREDVDLLKSTNIIGNQVLYQQYVASYPELQPGSGVFAFDLTWSEVLTLKATMFSPWGKYNVRRDIVNDGKEGIVSLDEFLSYAKNNSGMGAYVNLQNAYYLRTEHNLDMVNAVVTALTKANLTNVNDQIMIASEDSSALASIKNLVPSIKLVYNVPYNPNSPISVTSPVLQEIKKYANIVALDRRLVDPIDPNGSFLLSKTNVVSIAQALNMTVFYVSLSNEFNGFALDYRSDPILQIYSIIQEYNMDGFLTDHPKTLYNFLNKNYCYQPLAGKTVNMSTNQYPLFPVTPMPGSNSIAPSPALSVADPPVSYLVPEGSPGSGGAKPPAPSPNPSSATTLVASLFSAVALAITLLFTL